MMIKTLKQLFCRHRYGIKEWYPLDEEEQRLFKDTGLFVSCEKCNKFIVLFPKIPKTSKMTSYRKVKK